MKTLDLTNSEQSEIKYKINDFPDGQAQVNILEIKPFNLARYSLLSSHANSVLIKSRLNSFLHLELIICTVASLRALGVKEIHLYTPFFLGSRSDRKFEDGSNNYLKDVICPIINNLKLDSITILDPHSDVLEACLNGFRKISNIELVKFALADIYDNDSNHGNWKIQLVSPDAGASKKIYKIAEEIGYKKEIITCSKDRDVNGKLTKVVIPTNCIPNKDIIIIDDICDGGATFINIAKEIKKLMDDDAKLYLIVTHGIFSKEFDELRKWFDGIYCTNSYCDNWNGYIPLKDNKELLVKQLNVFE